jgi:hypothetical protein
MAMSFNIYLRDQSGQPIRVRASYPPHGVQLAGDAATRREFGIRRGKGELQRAGTALDTTSKGHALSGRAIKPLPVSRAS